MQVVADMNKETLIYTLSEDDYTLARIHWILQRNYRVESFKDSGSLSRAIDHQRPELVMLDTSSQNIDSDAVIARTKELCQTCTPYLLVSCTNRTNLGSLFRCNCIVGQVHLPLIPDQLISAVKHGIELSGMCKIRANLFNLPLPADPAELTLRA